LPSSFTLRIAPGARSTTGTIPLPNGLPQEVDAIARIERADQTRQFVVVEFADGPTTAPTTQPGNYAPVDVNDLLTDSERAALILSSLITLAMFNSDYDLAIRLALAGAAAGFDGAAGSFAQGSANHNTADVADADKADVNNAARHIAWSAYLAYYYGLDVAIIIGVINEAKIPPQAQIPSDREADYKNNQVGYDIAAILRNLPDRPGETQAQRNIRIMDEIHKRTKEAINKGDAYGPNLADPANPTTIPARPGSGN